MAVIECHFQNDPAKWANYIEHLYTRFTSSGLTGFAVENPLCSVWATTSDIDISTHFFHMWNASRTPALLEPSPY